jgi:dipeptidyl aminopeptidase/acylaminoacyl peptidase
VTTATNVRPSLASTLLRRAGTCALALVLAGGGAASPGAGGDGGDDPNGEGPPPAVTDTIAYVRDGADGRDQIRLIAPDGSGDRLFWPASATDPASPAGVTSLSWRPDGRALAFTSDHELTCSWWEVDVYVIASDGRGLRRVTNTPDCAGLAALTKGRVEVEVANATFSWELFQVYVQGGTSLEQISLGPGASGSVTFESVADLGAVVQPAVAVLGGYRWMGGAAADVLPGATVHAGPIIISGGGSWRLGAGGVDWHAGGQQLGYVFGECGAVHRISATPGYGEIGTAEVSAASTSLRPCAMAWGPTAATADAFLHLSLGTYDDNGIYLTTQGGGVGTRIVELMDPAYGEFVRDVAWTSDGSGVLFSGFLFPEDDPTVYDYASNLYHYDLATGTLTQVTSFTREFVHAVRAAPDGQQVVFELEPEQSSGEPFDLWIVRLDGSGLRRLVVGGRSPAWSR